jgi:hypothetical protein
VLNTPLGREKVRKLNTELAKVVAEIIRERCIRATPELDTSADIYEALISRGIQVPDGDMEEILDKFNRAGIVDCRQYLDRDGIRKHGAMSFISVNLQSLDQLEFD